MFEIVLASKSKVREEILKKNGIKCVVSPSNIDEDPVKKSLINEGATPEIISKNLAELKANKVSQKNLSNNTHNDFKKSNLNFLTDENDRLLKSLKRPGGSYRAA